MMLVFGLGNVLLALACAFVLMIGNPFGLVGFLNAFLAVKYLNMWLDERGY